jgi:LmeA-like phospholipid-binding
VPTRPVVQVHGTFVLAQAIRGRYEDVEITVADLSSGPLRVERVSADLIGVHLSLHDLLTQNADRVVVGRTVEHALLTAEDVNRYLQLTGRPVRIHDLENGHVRVSGTVPDVDRQVSATTVARLSPRVGALAVQPTEVTVDAVLDRPASSLLRARFSFPIPLDPLPFGQEAGAVHVGGAGLDVQVTGRGVVIRP